MGGSHSLSSARFERGVDLNCSRRHFLYASMGLLSAPAWAQRFDDRVGIALLDHGQGARARPNAVEQLLWETSKRTSISVREKPLFLKADDPNIFRSPLLVWLGNGPVEPLTAEQRTQLNRYLRGGGTLFIDDGSEDGDDRFDTAVRREMDAIWTDEDWVRFDNDHTVYRSFFLLQRPAGRVNRAAWLEGIFFDDRSPVLYGRNDLFGAFGRDALGRWTLPVVPGGRAQREMAFRLGINLIMYATCLNYKRDQVHVNAILRRRRWRIEKPLETQ